jgi:hypothetical protein
MWFYIMVNGQYLQDFVQNKDQEAHHEWLCWEAFLKNVWHECLTIRIGDETLKDNMNDRFLKSSYPWDTLKSRMVFALCDAMKMLSDICEVKLEGMDDAVPAYVYERIGCLLFARLAL